MNVAYFLQTGNSIIYDGHTYSFDSKKNVLMDELGVASSMLDFIKTTTGKAVIVKKVNGDEFLYDPTSKEACEERDYIVAQNLELQEAEDKRISDEEKSKARDEAMMLGFDYNGYRCSVTSDDGNGVIQAEAGFAKLKRGIELGLLPADTPITTVIKFRNGTELPMTESEFEMFSIIFTSERGRFFK